MDKAGNILMSNLRKKWYIFCFIFSLLVIYLAASEISSSFSKTNNMEIKECIKRKNILLTSIFTEQYKLHEVFKLVEALEVTQRSKWM